MVENHGSVKKQKNCMKQVIGEKHMLIELKLALGCSLEMTQLHQIKVLISSLKWYYLRNIVEYAYQLYFQ